MIFIFWIYKLKKNILIIFQTNSQYKVKISIDPDKTIGDLIENYFNKIKRRDLYGDQSIIFAKNGNIFMHNSTELIRPHFTGQNDGKIIIVNDVDDKIKSAQK